METSNQTGKTPRRSRWLWLLVILPLFPFFPVFPGSATYEGVGSARGEKINRPLHPQKFLLEGGKLYLLRRQTWHALLLTTYVRQLSWSTNDVQELRQRSPELNRDDFWE